ncbi:MAG TPA: NPCBM/NEW2 domain-containing protein [Terriglobia bacterium]|nr:NPCBM/NEW2 domain-containing protein [Terriglobia bacterium]
MNRRELIQRLIAVLGAMNLQKASAAGAEPLSSSAYHVRSSRLSVGLNKQGEIDSLVLHPEHAKKVAHKVSARTVLAGCKVHSSKARKLADGGVEFTKMLSDDHGGGSCRLRERFIPTDSGSVRWEIEILGEGNPWSTPIETHLAWPVTAETRFWTTCGDSRPEGSSEWNDPLIPAAFGKRTLTYGGKFANEGTEAFSVPIATVLEPGPDAGLSLALSPADVVPEMTLTTDPEGSIVFSRLYRRISKESPARFSLDLVAHPADWRGGLGWFVAHYPEYFDPPNPLTYQVAGLGAYSEYEGELDAYKFLSMGYRVNWKAGYDMYYMGLFLPPVGDDVEWICNRATTGTPEFPTSIAHLRRYSERMRQSGFHVLNYFNACEFGEHIEGPPPASSTKSLSRQDLWQNSGAYAFEVLKDAILYGPDGKLLHGWQRDVLMDPAEPVFQQYVLEQARRHIEKLPASSGLCFDEMQHLRLYNWQRDDGITWKDGRAARAMVVSWQEMMDKLGPLLVEADKVIYANPLYRRLDLMQHLDGFFDEFGELPDNLNLCGFMAVRKSHLVWTIEIGHPDPDTYIQRHLYLGAYLSAPFPLNNHDMMPCGSAVDQYFVDYGPMFDALRGRKWMLDPHVIEVEGQDAKANFFEIPGGYLAVVVMGGEKTHARISLRGLRQLPGQKGFAIESIQPGRGEWTRLSGVEKGERLVLDVALERGCAMIKLSYAWIKPERHYFIQTLSATLGTTIQGAQIHYTLDGRKPTTDSPVYSGPFTVDKTSVLQAAVFLAGAQTGSLLMAELVKTPPPAPWIEPFQSNFKDKVTVELRQPYPIPDAEIRYSLDGCELPNLSYSSLALPAVQNCAALDGHEVTSNSPLYSGPLELSATTSVHAKTFVPGFEPSLSAVGNFAKLPPMPPLPKVYVSDLAPLASRSANRSKPRNDRSVTGAPLSINGKKYERGLGVCSPSEVVYQLEPEYQCFVAEVGLDDDMRGRNVARTAFQVYVRNEREEMLVYSTPLLYPGELWPIKVEIPLFLGKREIRLACNGSTNWDHVDWVNAGFL